MEQKQAGPTRIQILLDLLRKQLSGVITKFHLEYDEITIETAPVDLQDLCLNLRDQKEFRFEQLIDLCGVDYLHYGLDEWSTQNATQEGFSRGVQPATSAFFSFDDPPPRPNLETSRFAIVYHLLSVTHNHRLRIRVFCDDDEMPRTPSVIGIWPSANWFEREAFDLFGVIFDGHPDLRRILTDYGFIGHPFRKDFPLIGHVEMRYDPEQMRVIYEPVKIEPRVLVPKVIRGDNRYVDQAASKEGAENG